MATTVAKAFDEFDARLRDYRISDTELAAVQLEGNTFHPEWNYTIKPRAN